MTDSKEDVAPCPFCNAVLIWDGYLGSDGVWVHPATPEDETDPGEPTCFMSAYMVRNRPASIARWNRRASSPPVGGSGEAVVKPLEWSEYEHAAAPSVWEANSILGWYTVHYFSSGWCWCTGCFDQNKDTGRDHFYSADEAKAAAQADYETRIRSALDRIRSALTSSVTPEGLSGGGE